MRFDTLLSAHARRHPDRPAVVVGERRVSFSAFRSDARRVASGLRALGVGPGDRVAIYLPNGLDFLQAFFGILYAGGVVVPVSTWLSLPELAHCCQDSGVRVLIIGSDHADAAAELLRGSGIRPVVVGATPREATSFAALLAEPEPETLDISPDRDECLILYTSGTTGKPKGAILSHDNLLVPAGFVSAVEWGISSEDRLLVATPLANRTGIGRITNAVTLGATLFVMPSFDPAAFVSLVEREAITVVGLVPTMCRRLLPALEGSPGRCSSLRRLLVTGEAFEATAKQRLLAALPNAKLVYYYGMTECGAVSKLEHAENFTHPTSVGRPALGVEIAILDENDVRVPAGETGELVLRGNPGTFSIMKGYHDRPEATREAIRHGWFRTGDLARQDSDGYLYIVDRKKDMIVSGGLNVYSKEVENVVNECPGVAGSAVVGVPDEDFGEAVVLFVEPKADEAQPEPEAILAHCRSRLASYKKPRHIFMVEALPRNSIGKVLRWQLAASAKARLHAGTPA